MLYHCGKSPAHQKLESYSIQIGANHYTFKQQMMYLTIAVELYRLHVGAYPNENNNLDALLSQPDILEGTGTWKGPYVVSTDVFKDPWGQRLLYRLDQQGKVDLRSLAEDGRISEDDIMAKDLFPDLYRELEKLPQMGPIPVIPNHPLDTAPEK